MIGLFDSLARPLLLSLDAENAHAATIAGLKFAPIPRRAQGFFHQAGHRCAIIQHFQASFRRSARAGNTLRQYGRGVS